MSSHKREIKIDDEGVVIPHPDFKYDDEAAQEEPLQIEDDEEGGQN